MSDLQCPATLLLVRPCGPQRALGLAERISGRNVAHVWCGPRPRAVRTAEIVADRLGTGFTVRAEPSRSDERSDRPEAVERLRSMIEEISDQYRGETVLVVCRGGLLEHVLPRLAIGTAPGHLARGALLELRVDADGMVVAPG